MLAEQRYLDDLEHHLRDTPILVSLAHAMGGGGHPSFMGILEGGIGVLIKPEDATGDAAAMARREVAAWRIARRLRFQEMVAATVLREVSSPSSGELVVASVQVLWPNNEPGVPENTFPAEDLTRAAVFDAVVRATDRHAGNWLGVPRPSAGAPRLKLIDHGHAFALQGSASSPFYLSRRGSAIPPDIVSSLHMVDAELVADLLADDERAALQGRLEELAAGVLDIGEP